MTLYDVTESAQPKKTTEKLDSKSKVNYLQMQLNSIVSNETMPEALVTRKANTLLEGCVTDEAKVQYYNQFLGKEDAWISKSLKV